MHILILLLYYAFNTTETDITISLSRRLDFSFNKTCIYLKCQRCYVYMMKVLRLNLYLVLTIILVCNRIRLRMTDVCTYVYTLCVCVRMSVRVQAGPNLI